jgi:hypothetical protein
MKRLGMHATILWTLLALPLAAWAQAPGTPSKPSAYALPEQTVAVIRLPDVGAYMAALRRQTRLGQVLLSDERQQKLVQLIQESNREEWGKLMAELGRFNLQPDDWKKLFAGEAGLAVVLEPRSNQPPLAIMLAWLEPGEDLAIRLISAMQKALAEGGEEAPRRTDFNLAGFAVMQLSQDVEGSLTEEDVQLEDEEPGEDDVEVQPQAEPQRVKLDERHMFVTRAGGRLLFGVAIPQSERYVRQQISTQQNVDFAALISDPARSCFARFLAAHHANDPGVLPRLLATPGMAQALPAGVPLLEMVINPAPLWQLLDQPQLAAARPILESLGLTKLGPIALRTALDGTTMRDGVFISLPSPRTGLCAVLDQTPVAAEPPAWLGASVSGFSVMGLDLGKVYATVKDLALQMGGPQAQQVITQVEGQVRIQLQAGPGELLAALGDKITMVSFPRKRGGAADLAAPEALAGLSERAAVVWQVRDQAICSRLMQFIQAVAPSTQGMMRVANEQGFSGVRLEAPGTGISVGFFFGKGHLLLGMGPEVCETVMSMINSPPQGNDALAASPLLARARRLLPPEPAFSYSFSDLSRELPDMRETLLQLLQAPQALQAVPGIPVPPADVSPEEAALIEKLKDIIPSAEELEGMLGVSTSLLVINSQGIIARSATELPAP